jgi:hypothetical protein
MISTSGAAAAAAALDSSSGGAAAVVIEDVMLPLGTDGSAASAATPAAAAMSRLSSRAPSPTPSIEGIDALLPRLPSNGSNSNATVVLVDPPTPSGTVTPQQRQPPSVVSSPSKAAFVAPASPVKGKTTPLTRNTRLKPSLSRKPSRNKLGFSKGSAVTTLFYCNWAEDELKYYTYGLQARMRPRAPRSHSKGKQYSLSLLFVATDDGEGGSLHVLNTTSGEWLTSLWNITKESIVGIAAVRHPKHHRVQLLVVDCHSQAMIFDLRNMYVNQSRYSHISSNNSNAGNSGGGGGGGAEHPSIVKLVQVTKIWDPHPTCNDITTVTAIDDPNANVKLFVTSSDLGEVSMWNLKGERMANFGQSIEKKWPIVDNRGLPSSDSDTGSGTSSGASSGSSTGNNSPAATAAAEAKKRKLAEEAKKQERRNAVAALAAKAAALSKSASASSFGGGQRGRRSMLAAAAAAAVPRKPSYIDLHPPLESKKLNDTRFGYSAHHTFSLKPLDDEESELEKRARKLARNAKELKSLELDDLLEKFDQDKRKTASNTQKVQQQQQQQRRSAEQYTDGSSSVDLMLNGGGGSGGLLRSGRLSAAQKARRERGGGGAGTLSRQTSGGTPVNSFFNSAFGAAAAAAAAASVSSSSSSSVGGGGGGGSAAPLSARAMMKRTNSFRSSIQGKSFM